MSFPSYMSGKVPKIAATDLTKDSKIDKTQYDNAASVVGTDGKNYFIASDKAGNIVNFGEDNDSENISDIFNKTPSIVDITSPVAGITNRDLKSLAAGNSPLSINNDNALDDIVNDAALDTTIDSFVFESNQPVSSEEQDYKVSLVSFVNRDDAVIFKISPTVDESRNAQYDAVIPAQHPGGAQVYKSTTPRTININGRFVARNTVEAEEVNRYMNLIRSWTMPYHGQGTANALDENNMLGKLGMPPDILKFNAYGNKNLQDIPVVLISYNWTYAEDVDYISFYDKNSNQYIAVPRLLDVSLSISEAYAPTEFSSFDLYSYKIGDLKNAFNANRNSK